MQAGTIEALGADILHAIAQAGAATDEQLSSLHFLFDSHLVKALQIVDQGGVWTFVGASSGRRVYQVHGQSADSYIVFPTHYCSCQVRRAARAWRRKARARAAVYPLTSAARGSMLTAQAEPWLCSGTAHLTSLTQRRTRMLIS